MNKIKFWNAKVANSCLGYMSLPQRRLKMAVWGINIRKIGSRDIVGDKNVPRRAFHSLMQRNAMKMQYTRSNFMKGNIIQLP